MVKYNCIDWTEDENAILYSNPFLSHGKMAEYFPERTTQAVRKQRDRLGLSPPRARAEYAHQHKNTQSISTISKVLGISPSAVHAILKQGPKAAKADNWSKEELSILKSNKYATLDSVCELLPHRTRAVIQNKQYELGYYVNTLRENYVRKHMGRKNPAAIAAVVHLTIESVNRIIKKITNEGV
jgi:hypothetical protein